MHNEGTIHCGGKWGEGSAVSTLKGNKAMRSAIAIFIYLEY